MRVDDLHYLLSPAGRQRLLDLAEVKITAANHLQLADQLSREVGPNKAHALLETAVLRGRAAVKFSRAAEMFFQRAALEQASAEEVALFRAQRFKAAGFGQIADLGCGIGGDSLALAACARVIGVDWDPVRLAMAAENVRVYGHGLNFSPLQADLLELSPLPVKALFADPGRRDEHGRRIYSVDDYRPPLSFLRQWRPLVPHQAVKVSPGIDYAELPGDAEVEFLSVQGEVREAILWFGDLHSGAARRATLLPGPFTLTDEPVAPPPLLKPSAYLYEPDGAVIRAHLVAQLARQLDACQIDPEIAYLTADKAQPTPFARCYSLADALPFQLKRLRHYLRERGIGRLTIKKRGSPIDPDYLRQALRLRGDRECTLFLTQVNGEPTVLVGQPHDPGTAGPGS